MSVRALVALACAGLGAAAVAVAQQSPPRQSPQQLFRSVLLADSHTASGVARLLRTNAGFVSPTPDFGDLTGDGRSDAVVTVDNAGAAGAVAVYVLSTDHARGGRLRAVLRAQNLYQAQVRTSAGVVTVTVPEFARGDDVCCTRRIIERDYAWSAKRRMFTRRATRHIRLS